MGSEPRFVFGPLERRALLLGLRGQQVGVLAGGLLGVLVMLWALPVPASVAAALVVASVAAGAVFVPVAGRTVEQWTPLVMGWGLRRLTGRHRFRAHTPTRGHGNDGSLTAHLPPELAGLQLLSAPVGSGGEIGVIYDRQADTYTALLTVAGSAFALLESGEKQRLLRAWDDLLRSLAGETSPVSRLQWIERTVPDDGDALGRDLRDRIAVPLSTPWAASYLQVLEEAGPVTTQHELYLAVQVSPRRAGRLAQKPGETRQEAACGLLVDQLRRLEQQLLRADLKVIAGGLSPRMVARVLRLAWDPAARGGLARRALHHPDQAGVDPANAWPLAADTGWASYRTDSAWHATFWVAEWPRTPVGADFLSPLLLLSSVTRTVAVTMRPVGSARAIREVEHARTSELAEQEIRQARGFLTTYRKRREQEALARRAAELHDGYADFRFSGFVTVTAPSRDELEAACAQVDQAASQAGLQLRRMIGRQEAAFTYTLPLARALR